MLVLCFVFLPADRHVVAVRSEYVATEAEVEEKVASRRKLLSLISSNPILRSVSLLGSKDLKPLVPEVFCLERALFLRGISFETYFDPIRDPKTHRAIKSVRSVKSPNSGSSKESFAFTYGKNKPVLVEPLPSPLPELMTETALKIPGTKEFMDVDQYDCRLLVALHNEKEQITGYVMRHISEGKLIVAFRGTAGGLDSPNW